MSTTEAALLTRGASQLYLSLGDVGSDGAIAVRLYHKPLVLLIWLGSRGDGARRRAVAVRPPPARRRAEARAPSRRCSRRSERQCGALASLVLASGAARVRPRSRCSPTKS